MSEDGTAVILDVVEERTTPEPDGQQDSTSNVWTGRRRLRQDGHKGSSPLERDEINGVIDDLVEDGELFEWHGLLAPATEEHLRAIIGNENRSDTPRRLLIEQAQNQLEVSADA